MFSKSIKNAIRPFYYAYEDVRDRGVLSKNNQLKNLHEGKTCYILGTGQSIDDIDLTLLANKYTIGSNFIFNHQNFSALNLTYWMAVPPLRTLKKVPIVHPDSFFDSVEGRITGMPVTLFLHASCRRFIEKRELFKEHTVYYLQSKGSLLKGNNLSLDLTGRTVFLEGSVFSMIATAIYMGFSRLYLIGCGYTFSPIQEFHFYEDRQATTEAPVNERHRIMHELAKDNAVNIINVVPDGFSSPIYDSITTAQFVEQVQEGDGC